MRLAMRLLGPKEMKGRGMPLLGARDNTTLMFMRACTTMSSTNPMAQSFR